MNLLELGPFQRYLDENIVDLYQQRMRLLQDLTLEELLREFCLFRPVHMLLASSVIENLLDAFLCSSGEEQFEAFLKGFAIFIARETFGGHQSTIPGVDLEFEDDETHYAILIRSGLTGVNDSRRKKLAQDLKNAEIRVKQSRTALQIQPVLGICYGKTRTNYMKAGYLKVVGQNFWYLISEDKDLYTDIIEPIGYRAKERNEAFDAERDRVVNRFTRQFLDEFCDPSGAVDWEKLVEFNSGNYDLDRFYQS